MSTQRYHKLYNFGHFAIKDIFLDEILIEEKVDGSQFSFRKRGDGKIFCRSKGVDIKIDEIETKHQFYKAVEVVKELAPSQKPVALLEYLVKTYTKENDLVLDFTMGSGTTGVACKNLNRKFIGMELDENYFKIAKERIENAESI